MHFILYKENKDTMDAINNIARMIKTKASSFGFAGTKDRRAATVQRVSIRRQRASNLSWLNTRLTGVRLSGFKHQKSPIQLGHLSGNLFHITLKNCHTSGDEKWSLNKRFPLVREAVQRGLANLKKYGYINYFGLQRFGTYSVGTHILGMKILQGDFEAVINDILHVDEHLVEQIVNNTAPIFENSDVNNTNLTSNADRNTRDELNRARALLTWKSTKNSAKALAHLPKRFSSEYSIIQHLGRETAERDFMGALRSITRGMRMMYCHAFQSFVWNHVASYRWSKYGSKVIVGDLVLVDDDLPRLSPDEDGDRESNSDEEQFYASARSLTQEEVASGKHSIFDVVLPQPGFDMVYPPNDVGDFYVEFMARPENGGIDPYNMRRVHKEFSLSGNYRHLMGRFMDEPEYALRVYTDDTEQMYPTDLDFCTQAKTDAKAKADSARAATRDRWANFSTLDAQYNALHAENRRRQAEERPMESVSRISQVWRQTGLDGDNKRVRIAKTRFESELPVSRVETDTGNHGSSLPAEEKSKAEEEVSVKAEVSVKVEETAPVLPAPPAASEPTAASISPAVDPTGTIKHYTPSSDSIGPSSAPVQTPGLPFGRPLGVHQAVQVLDGKGLSDVFYEKGTNHNSETEGAPAAQSDVAQLDTAEIVKNETVQTVDTESRAIKSDPDPAFDVVFNNGATSTQADQASESTTHEDSGKSQQVVNGIKLPVFFKAPDDPSAAIVDDGMSPLDFGSGNKIAVTLKFKLRSSNYATVVLRELQGLE